LLKKSIRIKVKFKNFISNFYNLSQICHNIQSITIEFNNIISDGIKNLISVQKNLKFFGMILDHDLTDNNNKSNLKIIIPSLIKKLPNTLIKLNPDVESHNFLLSFIINFKFLQELQLLFNIDENYIDSKDLQYVNFPQLQTLKIRNSYPKVNLLIKFLEINGRNLKELCLGDFAGYSDNSLNLVSKILYKS